MRKRTPETLADLLTVKQAAEALNVTASWLYRRAADRTIPHYRLGPKTIRFDRHDLEAWAGQRKEP